MLHMTLGRNKVLGLSKSLCRKAFIERNMVRIDTKLFFNLLFVFKLLNNILGS
jgi:hypothetical protein